MGDAERMLIHKALRFAVWAAGEGIAPVDGEPARDPEEFLTDYSAETDDEDWETLPERIIAALEAQLAARTGGVKVKALEWKRSATKYGWRHETTTPFGLEIVYEVLHEGINRVAYACWIEDYFQSAKEAKAAVQADYERRILSALSPAPEAHQEPVAWQLRYGYGPWACEITQSREVVDGWVRDGHGFRPLYARPALEPAPEAQQGRPAEQAVTEAMELARAVLARVMTAGYPNAPGPDPEDVEKAFWALDDALKAAMEARNE